MISTPNNHQKHANIARAALGEWNRNELAILGTNCTEIKQLAYQIIQQLPAYKIGYADADHKSADAAAQSVSAINAGAYAEYTNKISYTRLDLTLQPNTFQKKALLNNCDLVLVNGNHFTASKQILVIDEAKPLEKKLEKLTDVQLILVKEKSAIIPDYLRNHLPDIQAIPVLFFSDSEAIITYIQYFIQQQIPALNGLVLSGGQSTRMGADKGAIKYFEKSQREHIYDMLKPFCNEVFISCNAAQTQTIPGNLPFIQDSFLGLGPTGGILSAFQKNPNSAWLTVACDLPFLTKEIIQYLIAHRNPSKMATAFSDTENEFVEPLVTIWEPRAYPLLLQFLSLGFTCPRKALINSDIEILQPPNAFAFKNVNTAEEYRQAVTALDMEHNF